MSFASSQHVKQKASPSSIVPVISRTGSPKSDSEVNKVRGEFNPQSSELDEGAKTFAGHMGRTLQNMNLFV